MRWPMSASSDSSVSSVSAVATARHTVVGLKTPRTSPASGTPIIRWADGSPAATESALGAGCVRDVAIPVDPVGDIALRGSFVHLVRELLEPCGGARDFTPVPDSALLPGTNVRRAGVVPEASSRLPVLFALLALAALAAEQVIRRRKRGA